MSIEEIKRERPKLYKPVSVKEYELNSYINKLEYLLEKVIEGEKSCRRVCEKLEREKIRLKTLLEKERKKLEMAEELLREFDWEWRGDRFWAGNIGRATDEEKKYLQELQNPKG